MWTKQDEQAARDLEVRDGRRVTCCGLQLTPREFLTHNERHA